MAIYRPRRSRWPALLAVSLLGFVLGGAVGAFVVGTREPDLEVMATTISDGLNSSAGLLEVTEIEYAEAVAPGGGEAEFQGALANLERSKARYDTVANALTVLDPPRAQRIATGFADLRTVVEQRTDAIAVSETIANLRAELLGN